MGRNSPGEESEGSRFAWLVLLLAIPAMTLCCGGPLLLAAGGEALAAAAAWVRGFGGLALLAAAGMLAALWWARQRTSAGPTRWSQIVAHRGGAQ